MPDVSYNRVNFEDKPSTNTPINATNLNKMDKGIKDCAVAINASNQDLLGIKTNLKANNKDFKFGYSGGKYGYQIDNTFYPFKNPTGQKSITANGTYDVTDYASAIISVPTASTAVQTLTTNATDGTNASIISMTLNPITGARSAFSNTNNASATSGVSTTYGTLKYGNVSGAWKWTFTFNRNVYCNGTAYNSGSSISWTYNTVVGYVIIPR